MSILTQSQNNTHVLDPKHIELAKNQGLTTWEHIYIADWIEKFTREIHFLNIQEELPFEILKSLCSAVPNIDNLIKKAIARRNEFDHIDEKSRYIHEYYTIEWFRSSKINTEYTKNEVIGIKEYYENSASKNW